MAHSIRIPRPFTTPRSPAIPSSMQRIWFRCATRWCGGIASTASQSAKSRPISASRGQPSTRPCGRFKSRAAWPAAEPTRSQGWAQDLCRGCRLRGRSQGRKAKADNLAMSRGDRDTVWHQGPSAELGARAGAQKKTNQSGLTRIISSATHTCTSANHRHVRSPSTMKARSLNTRCGIAQLQPVGRSSGFG